MNNGIDDISIIGEAFVDIVLPIGKKNPGETYFGNIITTCGGLANVAILIARLGARVKYIAKIGDDVFGKYLKDNLEKEGVESCMFVDRSTSTGLCVSQFYPNGERTMIANRGANDLLTRREINTCLDRIMSSKAVYLSGYSMVNRPVSDTVSYILKQCNGKLQIWFNPGAPNIISKSLISLIAKHTCTLVLNYDEAREMTGKTSLKEICENLKKIADIAVITLGKKGCLVCSTDSDIRIPAKSIVNLRDTTGAGDAFAAGFVLGKVRGHNLRECGQLGVLSASGFLEEKARLLQ